MNTEREFRGSGWAWVVCGVSVCLVLGARVPTGFAEDVPESEHVRVLRMLSAHSKQTWDGVRTWRGELRVDSVRWFSGEKAKRFFEMVDPLEGKVRSTNFKRITHQSVTFAVDLEHDRVFSRPRNWPDVYVDVETGKPFGIQREDMWFETSAPVSIVTADAFITFEPNMPHPLPSGGTARAAFRYPLLETAFHEVGVIGRTFSTVYYAPAPGESEQAPIVDPRAYLSTGRPVWMELELIADAIEQTGPWEIDGLALRVRKEGSGAQEQYHLAVPAKSGSGRYMQKEMTFRADVGFSIILQVQREPGETASQERRWAYKEQAGLFLPSLVETKRFDTSDGSLRSQDTVSFIESEVNKAIAPETFTCRNLGMQEGDRVVDKSAGGRVSVYEGGTLKVLDVVDVPGTSREGTSSD